MTDTLTFFQQNAPWMMPIIGTGALIVLAYGTVKRLVVDVAEIKLSTEITAKQGQDSAAAIMTLNETIKGALGVERRLIDMESRLHEVERRR